MFDDFSAGISLTACSRYVWRGINTVDDFVLQPSVDLGLGGFGLNLRGNLDLTDENDRELAFTEVDVPGSCSFNLEGFNLGVRRRRVRLPGP